MMIDDDGFRVGCWWGSLLIQQGERRRRIFFD